MKSQDINKQSRESDTTQITMHSSQRIFSRQEETNSNHPCNADTAQISHSVKKDEQMFPSQSNDQLVFSYHKQKNFSKQTQGLKNWNK